MSLKLAHLILAHAYPEQLERLIKRLQHPNADIYIHVDKKSDIGIFSNLLAYQNVFFIENRSLIDWGTYSLVRATLDSMEAILQTKIGYSHINLLSPQDYPLKNAEEINTFFMANTGKSFLDSKKIGKEWKEGVHRVENYSFGDFKFKGHYHLQYAINFLHIKKRKPKQLTLLGRSQWFSITPECAAYVVYKVKNEKKLRNYFRLSFAPDEFIFQTILGNSRFAHTLVNDNLRHIIFKDGAHHPTVLTMADALILISSNKLYARKFDPKKDELIMNYLDWVAEFGLNINSPEYKCINYILTRTT
ncbi:beta-1,6-N-acetylglucosaminyltransferase [Mucilaginibacter ginkgonis]|uniref:Peptide O-xylosyltransferase n=1 Tax=Mucilaginibacter ginkgonis TaxID=2682091 RepID=A0A6I4HWA8_9SPHI|nr:beta-1,6-N-acetylglucosaminyltransferase [Mucilaginibacter ginkgonis]QQL51236.1 glycosyl transferase [Mucilaginibacter ginkgonis]